MNILMEEISYNSPNVTVLKFHSWRDKAVWRRVIPLIYPQQRDGLFKKKLKNPSRFTKEHWTFESIFPNYIVKDNSNFLFIPLICSKALVKHYTDSRW